MTLVFSSPYIIPGLRDTSKIDEELKQEVFKAVAKEFKVSEKEMMETRNWLSTEYEARQVVCYLLKDYIKMTHSQISRYVKRDRGAIIGNIRNVRNLMDVDKKYKAKVDRIRLKLLGE